MEHLIIKLLTDTISDEELKDLKAMVGKPSNRKKLEEYLRTDQQLNLHFFDGDVDGALKKVMEGIGSHGQSESKPVVVFKKYRYMAVAASLALFMALGGYLFVQDNTSTETIDAVQITEEIPAGSNKATLTLANGEQVVLEQGMVYKKENAESDGEKLEYEKGVAKTAELTYNDIIIPRGGQFVVTLSDGTKVWLNSDSKLKYPVKFAKGSPREVELVYGEAYFDVSPSENNKGASFVVKNQYQNIEVLGTEFNVKAYKDDSRYITTLAEGKVAISAKEFGKMLSVGEKAMVDIATGNIKVDKADVMLETAWKNGRFVFKGEPLNDMMKVLSRWYNVEIKFNDSSKSHIKFSGNLNRTENLEELLKRLEMTEEVRFKYKGNNTILVE
ncbi:MULTISPECIES: FecR family protein [Flavobacteriaceae]|uniref:FecR family protein n=1 Tax=Flavobacteriaceae TaxID=49546 RepID=UPI001491F582|nr:MULTISPECIES: FecR domain-containing protein [Allomuricauda]MDC6366799.1 DUF4974 domain-containing protein [Muricauda sp. AC10]